MNIRERKMNGRGKKKRKGKNEWKGKNERKGKWILREKRNRRDKNERKGKWTLEKINIGKVNIGNVIIREKSRLFFYKQMYKRKKEPSTTTISCMMKTNIVHCISFQDVIVICNFMFIQIKTIRSSKNNLRCNGNAM